ncbi:helix-turn-helix domain-containing protein [Gracilibacillus salitolerans]|uniref:Helix-turn-helix domain-containing protein n=1 Tax=Gracilibacillus salitolerans TaxID=2663022 RepID=A0A5Q2TMQ8_9BACI|nr:AraC family transcriptional regulator [Gracilibacillus salitolerans]QGH36239.1 helix-turn-helix domain-containing protein [Gracilibacillus salitolerans]
MNEEDIRRILAEFSNEFSNSLVTTQLTWNFPLVQAESNLINEIELGGKHNIPSLVDHYLETVNSCSEGDHLKIRGYMREFIISIKKRLTSQDNLNEKWSEYSEGLIDELLTTRIPDLSNFLLEFCMTTVDHVLEGSSCACYDIINKCKDMMEQKYSTSISLKELAQLNGVSPAYLSKIFKQETGMNYKDYLQQIRIKNAKLLLKQSNLTIDQVAMKIGFQQPNYFINLFKKQEKITPKQYQMKRRENLKR